MMLFLATITILYYVQIAKIFPRQDVFHVNENRHAIVEGQLQEGYKKLEARLEEKSDSTDSSRRYVKENRRYISTTDPDASIVNRGKPKPPIRYIGRWMGGVK